MTYLISNLKLQNNTILPLPQFNNQWAIKKYNNSVSVTSNSCLHRGAIIVREEQPFLGNMTCPMHKWTYDSSGVLMGEPFENAKGCLDTQTTHNWNNLLFTEDPQIKNFPTHLTNMISLDNYVHVKTDTKILKSSWQIFMEVHLDLYHVDAYHPGLSKFVDPNNFNWHFGDTWCLQEMMRDQSQKKIPCNYFNELNQIINSRYPQFKHGALWMTIYPNITIEWYPNTIIIGTIWPTQNPNESMYITEFHYADHVVAYDKEFIELQMAAYETTDVEDGEILEFIQLGRNKDVSYYPTHPVLEKGIGIFYEYLKTNDFNKMFKVKQFE